MDEQSVNADSLHFYQLGVSVLTTVYRGEKLLRAALISAKKGTDAVQVDTLSV